MNRPESQIPEIFADDRRRTAVRVVADTVIDGDSVAFSPGCLLIEDHSVSAVGTPQQVGQVPWAQDVSCKGMVVMPGLVNAHTHLDLSDGGPRVPGQGDPDERFRDFGSQVMEMRRASTDEQAAGAVDLGIVFSLAGGTVAVGDIAGTAWPIPAQRLGRSRLRGVSFREVFGMGSRAADGIEALRRAVEGPHRFGHARLGLQPHAEYSCSPEVYAAAIGHGLPLSTHMAELEGGIEFVATGQGRFRKWLEEVGFLVGEHRPLGAHPIPAMADVFTADPWICAHVNYADDDVMDAMIDLCITVAYCPRSSTWFGHDSHERVHPYRDMLERGIRVALGTDSILNLDTPERISVLDEMRLLYQRDGTDPQTLLKMATIHGAVGLGLDPEHVCLSTGPVLGVIGVATSDGALSGVLTSDAAPQWVLEPVSPTSGAVQ